MAHFRVQAASAKGRASASGHPKNGKESAGRLGTVIDEWLRSSGLNILMKNPRLHEAWQSTVGPEFAEHTRISRFQRGILEIAVDSSARLTDLQFHRAALLQDLRRAVRDPFIKDIFFVQKAIYDCDE